MARTIFYTFRVTRSFSPALALLATLCAGCGGVGVNLFATVPPPVEFRAEPGLMELPASGIYRGTLTEEHVVSVRGAEGVWSEVSATEIRSGRAEAVVDGKQINLHRDGETVTLFSGAMQVTTGRPSHPAGTYVTLQAFDGHHERFRYTLLEGSPRTLRIAARGKIQLQQERAEFDRYTFELRP